MRPRFEHFKGAARWLLGAFIGITLYANYGPDAQPEYVAGQTRTDTVYVTQADIEKKEPDAKVGRIERITRPTVRPDYVAIAQGAGDSTVAGFCEISSATVKRDQERKLRLTKDSSMVSDSLHVVTDDTKRDHGIRIVPDSTEVRLSPILIRSIRTDSRLFPWQRSSLYAVSVSGSGDLIETRYQVRQGYSARADSDSLVVQHPRLIVRPVVGSLILFGAGALVGAVLK